MTALTDAVQKGNLNKVNTIVNNTTANINKKDFYGITPLEHAIADYQPNATSEKILKLLIEKGANLNQHVGLGTTPLIWAIGKGYDALAMFMIKNGAASNFPDKEGNNPLYWATYRRGAEFKLSNKFPHPLSPAIEKEAFRKELEALNTFRQGEKEQNLPLMRFILENGGGKDINLAPLVFFLQTEFKDNQTPVLQIQENSYLGQLLHFLDGIDISGSHINGAAIRKVLSNKPLQNNPSHETKTIPSIFHLCKDAKTIKQPAALKTAAVRKTNPDFNGALGIFG